MKSKKIIIILLTIFALHLSVYAENIRKIIVVGTIVEKESQHPLEYATVSVHKLNGDILTGGISDQQGKFKLETSEDEIFIKVSFIGYESINITEFNRKGFFIDLGKIELGNSSVRLEDVVVRAEKSKTVFKLDKRVFNVGKDLVSAGGTAMDILNNVPSVDVSIEGVVSLRGNSSVQILLNGKPSVMASSKTLGTITAEMIEKVEVVTNPSAKYDAEGSSGIINIILKKDEKKGINGAITLNVGTPDNYSVGLSLNRRAEKWNLFTQLGAGYRTFLSESEDKTINKLQRLHSIAKTEGEKNELFYNFILGADYHITPLQTLSMSGHYGYEFETEGGDTRYNTTNLNAGTTENAVRTEDTESTNPKWQYDLNYKKEFTDNKEHVLTANLTGSYFGKDKESFFTNTGSINSLLLDQKIVDDFYEARYNFQTDYVHPFSKELTLESGAKYNLTKSEAELIKSNKNNSNWIVLPNQSNLFNYERNIIAVYSTFAFENDRWGTKIGLRVENEHTNSYLENTNANKQNNTNLFPSIHSSLKFSKEFSLQAGYSRRIRRPHLWDLNPFESFNDPFNVKVGNPDLKPSFSNSYEITAIKIFNLGSINTSLFYTKTSDVVDDIYQIKNNVKTVMPLNVGYSKKLGFELNSKIEPVKWLSLLVEGNYFHYQRTGEYQNQNFDFSNEYWSTRFTTKFKLPYDIDLEYKFRYRSRYKALQGYYKESHYSDLGIRKQFMKGRAVVNLSVKDLFNTRKHVFESENEQFYTYNSHQRSKRIIVLGFSFGFGKGDTMEYSGLKMF